MNNLNSVLLEGNMIRDPLIRSTPNGSAVCSFTVASSRFFKQGSGFEKETCFIDIEAWGKLADSCSANGGKGRGVRVVGRLRQDRWASNTGENRSRIVIVAEHIEYRPQIKNGSLPEEDFPEAETQELNLEFEPCSA